jgi:hypothetical protein
MSDVTRVILHISYAEHYTELVESGGRAPRHERRYKGVDAINAWLDAPERDHGTLRFVSPYAGGGQIFTGALFLGAFNYLDLYGLIEQVKAFPWEEPWAVQLWAREDEEDVFSEYDLELGSKPEEEDEATR